MGMRSVKGCVNFLLLRTYVHQILLLPYSALLERIRGAFLKDKDESGRRSIFHFPEISSIHILGEPLFLGTNAQRRSIFLQFSY
jgi:hypothetical protein